MMDYGWVTIPGQVPAKANSYKIGYRGGHPTLVKDDAVGRYEAEFYWRCPASLRNLEVNRPFEFYVRVYFTSVAHDLDNALKTLLDCLQYTKTIKNDNKCAKIVAEKCIDKATPRVEFRIVEL